MRNPNRLDNFYEELKQIHKKYFPDWRFGQFIVNFLSYCGDPFYMEEDRFIEKVKEYIKAVCPNA